MSDEEGSNTFMDDRLNSDLRAIAERIARLESRAESHAHAAATEAEVARRERELVEEHFTKLEAELSEIRGELSRYRGIFGGVLLAATAIGAFFKLFGGTIIDFIRGL